MIRLYTAFTDTHEVFIRGFLKTYPFDTEMDLVVRYMPQECPSGVYESSGFSSTMKRKVEMIVQEMKKLDDGDIMIYADNDIVFLKPFKNILLDEMGDVDIIFQNDWNSCCMGLFACKISPRVRDLFNRVLTDLDRHAHDQDCMNYLLRNINFGLKIKLMSPRFFNHGFLGKRYEGEDTVNFPSDMVLLHANFAVGIEYKKKILDLALKTLKI